MITGFFKTNTERFENVVVNATMLTQIGTVLLKVAGMSTLTWLLTFAPLAVLLTLIVSSIVLAIVGRKVSELKAELDLLKWQKQNRTKT